MSSNSIRLIAALVLWAGLGDHLFSQDSPIPATSSTLGKVLVLDTERCLEGDVELVGEQYRVRQGGSEVWLSAKKVLRVCPDWKAAYEFVRQRANLDDPDERLRLARWCQLQNRLPEALAEAKIAQDLRPMHTETRHLVRVLTESLETRKTATPGAAPVTPIDTAPMPDLSPEALAQFTHTVQPILFNTCISCHNTAKGGGFQLYRTGEGGSRAAMQRNVKAVLSYIRFDRIDVSPLLVKAASPHGGPLPPLAGKKSIPYQSLEKWVHLVVTAHPHLKEAALARMVAEGKRSAVSHEGPTHFASADLPEPLPAKDTLPAKDMPKAKDKRPAKAATTDALPTPPLPGLPPGESLEKILPKLKEPPRTEPVSAGPREAVGSRDAAASRDPYGEAEFNRVNHPGRKRRGSGD